MRCSLLRSPIIWIFGGGRRGCALPDWRGLLKDFGGTLNRGNYSFGIQVLPRFFRVLPSNHV